MNGIIDQQSPSWNLNPSSRNAMLHENLDAQISPNINDRLPEAILADLDHQMDEHDKEFNSSLETLRSIYMFSDHDVVQSYLKSNRTVVPVLIEAFPYMSRAFSGSPLLLDVMTEDGTPRTINALALWWGKREDARTALRSFDDSWWLDNIGKANGRIVFDYQIEK
jgi:hypothetical protein